MKKKNCEIYIQLHFSPVYLSTWLWTNQIRLQALTGALYVTMCHKTTTSYFWIVFVTSITSIYIGFDFTDLYLLSITSLLHKSVIDTCGVGHSCAPKSPQWIFKMQPCRSSFLFLTTLRENPKTTQTGFLETGEYAMWSFFERQKRHLST